MARKDNLDFVDKAVESANLQEKTKQETDVLPKIQTGSPKDYAAV